MTPAGPAVSVVIPAWNEERSIAGCLAAVAAQTWPIDDLEVIVVDGASTDRTAQEAQAAASALGLTSTVVTNPARRTSSSLNVGLAAARGRILVRLDARSRVQGDYIETCVAALDRDPTVGVVGGAQVASAGSDDLEARAIARSLRNRWFTGLSRYRRAVASGPSDTVWMGTFRTDELRAIGGWDASIALNEDFELNERYRAVGKVVWFEVGLRSTYVPRPDLRALAIQYFRFGRVKGTWWSRGRVPNGRQVCLLLAPFGGLGAAWALSRRIGPVPTLATALAVGLVLDELGADGPPRSPAERPLAVVAAATSTTAWLVGVAAGTVGERLGVEHPHG